MKSILCYGDSNTWGFVPGAFVTRDRYDRETRWTGRLQGLLDPKQFYVIEEGLNGRTTNLDYGPKPDGRRGTEFLLTCLYTHSPLDLVVIMLGINDLKQEFGNRTSEQTAQGIKELIDIIRSTNYGPKMQKAPPVLIVSMPIPVPSNDTSKAEMFEGARERAQSFARDFKAVVDQYGQDAYFLDAAPHIQLSPVDGIHFDERAHEQFAILINKTIRTIF